MRARGYFWILAGVMLTALGLLTWILFKQGLNWYFIAAEVLIAVILVLLFLLYSRVVKPLEIIGNGMDLLKEQDFGSRLGYVGQKDADRVVEIFNKMMTTLREERLHVREQNHLLDLLIQSSPMGVLILDLDGKVSSLNPAAKELFGSDASSIIGQSLEGSASPLLQKMSLIPADSSEVIRSTDGSALKCSRASFVDRGFHHTFYLMEQMTEELLKAEKKAYGQVIRMISHEVNNSMAGVTSTLDTVTETFDSTLSQEDINEITDMLSVASSRCRSLSKFITAFADVVKIPQPQLEKVSLNDFVTARLRFLESICAGKKIALKADLSEVDCQVMLDEVLMEQVLLNAVKNASEAIEEDGVIMISTVTGKGMGQVPPTNSCEQNCFKLVISDNGHPISPEVEEKLFTPFFSTKSDGQGIGLIVIREILLRHGFRFSLHTDSDRWTRLDISGQCV